MGTVDTKAQIYECFLLPLASTSSIACSQIQLSSPDNSRPTLTPQLLYLPPASLCPSVSPVTEHPSPLTRE